MESWRFGLPVLPQDYLDRDMSHPMAATSLKLPEDLETPHRATAECCE